MKRAILIAVGLLAGAALVPFLHSTAGDEAPLFGFSAESSRTERQWEEKFRSIPNPENHRAYMQHLTAHPHNVGKCAAFAVGRPHAAGLNTPPGGGMDQRDLKAVATCA